MKEVILPQLEKQYLFLLSKESEEDE